MAVADLTTRSLSTPTVPWTVDLRPPRGRSTSYSLRARRTVDGERDEKSKPTGTDDRFEAERQAADWQADLNGTAVAEDPTVLAIYDAHVTAMTINGDAKQGTLTNYRTARAALIADTTLTPMKVSEISRRHLLAAQQALRSTGPKGKRAPRTVNGWLDFVRAAWHRALTHEQITKPWPHVDPLDCTEPTLFKRAYEVQEIDDVLSDMREHDPYWFPVFCLLAATACRVSEVVSRRARDVLTGTIVVRTTKTGMPKEVGVPEAVMSLVPGREPNAFLFPTPGQPSRHVTPASALKALRRSLERLKIADRESLDVHSFRRAWCADSEDAGVSRNQAMGQTGHRSGKVFDVYASKARGRRRETAEKVQAHRREVLGGRDPGAPMSEGSQPAPVVAPNVPPSVENELIGAMADKSLECERGRGARARPTGVKDDRPVFVGARVRARRGEGRSPGLRRGARARPTGVKDDRPVFVGARVRARRGEGRSPGLRRGARARPTG